MSTYGNPPFPSLAQNLAPEVLDQIFKHYFTSSSISIGNTQSNAKDLSLVCRSWRDPVQRYLFQAVTIESVTKMRQLGRVKTDLGQHIQELVIKVISDEGRWKIRELNKLLATLPRLTTLKLHLNSESPGYMASYSMVVKLPQIQHLSLHSMDYDPNMASYRDILAVVPNITSLRLHSAYCSSKPYPTRKSLVPVELSRLESLSLQHYDLSMIFDKLQLISVKTLKQIRTLELDRTKRYPYRPPGISSHLDFMKLVGASLTTLSLPISSKHISDDDLFACCPNVQHLITYRQVRCTPPPSISTIDFIYLIDAGGHIPEDETLCGCFKLNHGLKSSSVLAELLFEDKWRHIKRANLRNTMPTAEAKEYFFKKGIELVVDGVLYTSPSPTA